MREWEHRCDQMPDELNAFCKLEWDDKSLIHFRSYRKGVVFTEVTLYGFKYCPYCGIKLGEEE